MSLTSSYSNLEEEVDIRELSILLKFKVIVPTETWVNSIVLSFSKFYTDTLSQYC